MRRSDREASRIRSLLAIAAMQALAGHGEGGSGLAETIVFVRNSYPLIRALLCPVRACGNYLSGPT
jgi:hypothetical protein